MLLAILDSWRSAGRVPLSSPQAISPSSSAAQRARSRRWLDSLGANAFGIFLLHYVAVSWLQLALLERAAIGALKGLVVFAGAVAANWIATPMLRRIPALAKVL